MRIGIDIRTLMDRFKSGVPEYTRELLKGIFELDWNNEYVLFYNSGRDVSGHLPAFSYPNVKISRLRYPNKLFNNIMQNFLQAPKIDRVIGVGLFFMPNPGFIALSGGCRKIITVHDLSFLRFKDFFSLKRRLWHRALNVPRLLRGFDTIVAVSDNTKSDLIELGRVSPDKIKVIYSGVNGFLGNAPDALRAKEVKRKYALPEKYILFLGTVEPRKNVSGLIRAYDLFLERFPELSDYRLVIAGGPGWKRSEIIKAWRLAKHKEQIKFIGYIDDGDKIFIYQAAAIFVYPSFYEGFGFPPLEAMAAGLPVIISQAASLPEIAGEASILVNPYNAADIAEAIGAVLKDPGLKENLRQKSRLALDRYSWQNAARSYLAIFNGK